MLRHSLKRFQSVLCWTEARMHERVASKRRNSSWHRKQEEERDQGGRRDIQYIPVQDIPTVTQLFLSELIHWRVTHIHETVPSGKLHLYLHEALEGCLDINQNCEFDKQILVEKGTTFAKTQKKKMWNTWKKTNYTNVTDCKCMWNWEKHTYDILCHCLTLHYQ